MSEQELDGYETARFYKERNAKAREAMVAQANEIAYLREALAEANARIVGLMTRLAKED